MKLALTLILTALMLIAVKVHAQHEARGQVNAPQHLTINNDVSITATPVQLLPVNLNRVTAVCQNKGSNTLYLGDSVVSATHGITLASGAGMTLDITDGIWAMAPTSTTGVCHEIVR